MFERRTDPLLPRRKFYIRLRNCAALGASLILGSLLVGMTCYHFLERMPWVDAYLEACMILSGMGPVAQIKTTAGKLFAGAYAVYSGVALLSTTALMFTPVVHRFLHKFHLERKSKDD